jgi:hypothetical protein
MNGDILWPHNQYLAISMHIQYFGGIPFTNKKFCTFHFHSMLWITAVPCLVFWYLLPAQGLTNLFN